MECSHLLDNIKVDDLKVDDSAITKNFSCSGNYLSLFVSHGFVLVFSNNS